MIRNRAVMMPVMLYKIIIATAVVGEGPRTLFGGPALLGLVPLPCAEAMSSVILVDPWSGPLVFNPFAREEEAFPSVMVYSAVLG